MLLSLLGRGADEVRPDLAAGPFRRDGINRRMSPMFVAAMLGFLAANAGSPFTVLKYVALGLAGFVALGAVVTWWSQRPPLIQAVPIAAGMAASSWIAFPDNVGLLGVRVLTTGIVLAATVSVFTMSWERIPTWWQTLPPVGGLVGVLIIQLFAESFFALFPLTLLVLTFLALYYPPPALRATLGIVIVLTLAWVIGQGSEFSDVVIGALIITVLAIVSLRVNAIVLVASRAMTTAGQQALELHQRASELEVARAQAEAASRAKSDHVSRMSHELRTPMSAILGFADLLSMSHPRPDQVEDIEAIQRAGDHLAQLIDDVLELSRLEAVQSELPLTPVNVGDAIAHAQRMLRLREMAHGVTITLEGDHGRAHVSADNQRLRQVLLNLLSNGVKYNRPGGTVTVRTTAGAGRVVIEVVDSGYGIAPELQGRLFQPFDRLGAERSTIEGTGLGLAVSKAWVEAMGGTIHVSSEPGEGSMFTVELARAEPVPAGVRRGERDGRKARRRGAGRSVVYIEDNQDNIDLVRTVMAQERPLVQLMVYEHAQEALGSLENDRPDLILLDLHLSDLDGVDVLQRIRRTPGFATTPVVMLTADATPKRRDLLMSLGASEYVTKPFKVKELLRVVDERLSAAAAAAATVADTPARVDGEAPVEGVRTPA